MVGEDLGSDHSAAACPVLTPALSGGPQSDALLGGEWELAPRHVCPLAVWALLPPVRS